VTDKSGRVLLHAGIVRPLPLKELQSVWMAQAIHDAESVTMEECDLDETTVVQRLAEMEAQVVKQQRRLQDENSTSRLLTAEKRLLQAQVDEARKRVKFLESEASPQAMWDGTGGEILRMRRALRDVPSDDFPYTYEGMTGLMQRCDAPNLLLLLTAGTIRDHHDSRGAHTLDVTRSPTSAAEKTVELRVCFAIAMYIFAGTTRDVPMQQTLTSLRSEAKDTQEMATGRFGVTKCQRQRQRDDRRALAKYAVTQYNQWCKSARRNVDGVIRFLTTVLWDDDYMR
jgi:hypothetical protein